MLQSSIAAKEFIRVHFMQNQIYLDRNLSERLNEKRCETNKVSWQ